MERVRVLDVSQLSYAQQLAAASLQGLANRQGPHLYLDWGIYDDVSARTTNEVFLPEEIWHTKYRPYVGNSDQINLAYYQKAFDLSAEPLTSLTAAVQEYMPCLRGLVVWDPALPDTINVALVLAGLEDLLVVHPDLLTWASEMTGLLIVHDLRGRWQDRVCLYEWAMAELFPACTSGLVACIEPGWERPEFADYVVQRRIFAYSLSSHEAGRAYALGQKLLLLLVAGPWLLRTSLFALRLDSLVRWLGLALMAWRSPEVRLASRIQRSVAARPFPTLFGWHTRRDDELSFMMLLSANGLRLVPSHLASNFSFHSQVPSESQFKQDHASPADVHLEADKVYLTFTLSDGDQLVLMGTSELGNWRREARGAVPFNWETQPLLAEIAPALLGRYYATRTANDYLIAGPSGAGYVIPPLLPNLEQYMNQTAVICRRSDVRVVTSYIADPPRRIVRAHAQMAEAIGVLAGYVHFGRTPCYHVNGKLFIANQWPHLEQIWDDSDACLAAVRQLLDTPGSTPRFVGVHLSAYKTTIDDVYEFVSTLDPRRVKVVRADEFLLAAAQHQHTKRSD